MEIINLAKSTEDFTGNVWLISGEENVLIDTGTGDCWQNIQNLKTVDKVVLTHSHYDHVDNLPKVLDKFDSEIYSFEPENLPVESKQIEEGDSIELSGTKFDVFHTPGHKDDSICLYSPEEKILFAGDLLFPKGGFGRTDLEEGDRNLLIDSIEKILKLDVKEMYCGHNPVAKENVNQQIQKSLEAAKKNTSRSRNLLKQPKRTNQNTN